MDELLFKVIELLLILIITAVMRYGIPFVKQKMETEKLKDLMQWVDKAVDAAEQTLKDNPGKEKKAIVTEFVREILRAKNISITDEQMDTLIEAAVFAMKQGGT